jgi:glycosyltransferase involved in cell wall biosynthesis
MNKTKEYRFVPLEEADLTIITLTYDSSKYIGNCIQSIIHACHHLNNSFQVSHLVVDGKSKDNTIDIIQSISPSSLIIFREPAGIYEALNYAVSLVKSTYLMYVHSDDEVDEYFLSNMSQRIRKLNHNQCYILYGTVDFINENSDILFSRQPPFFILAVQQKASIIFHPNAIYSTLLEKLHPYNLDKGLSSDREHIATIAPQAKLIRVCSAKYRFRMSVSSSTIKELNVPNNNKNLCVVLAKFYVLLFETNLIQRLLMKLNGKSYWKDR